MNIPIELISPPPLHIFTGLTVDYVKALEKIADEINPSLKMNFEKVLRNHRVVKHPRTQNFTGKHFDDI